MHVSNIVLVVCILLWSTITAWGQGRYDEMIYKRIDTTSLKMQIYYPDNFVKGKKYPAIILFFGGSWNTGSLDQFRPHAQYFASKGMIGIVADYRVKTRQQTTPFESVKDGRSAIRYLRANAKKLGIHPSKIVAGGGSAGGHVAAAADLTNLDEATDNLKINARPNALVLFNPVFNNGPGYFGYERFQDRYVEISPYHNIKKGAAPTIVFFGTADNLIPVKVAEEYKQKMESVGSRCDLFLYEGQQHGFFNYKPVLGNTYYDETLKEASLFLKELGFMP